MAPIEFEHERMIDQLEKYKVEYIVTLKGNDSIGKNKSLDLWLKPTERNKLKLIKAINSLGYDGDVLKRVVFPQHILSQGIQMPMQGVSVEFNGKLSIDHDFELFKGKASKINMNFGARVKVLSLDEIAQNKLQKQTILSSLINPDHHQKIDPGKRR